MVLDPDLGVTLWEQLAQIIRDRIESETYTGRLPSAKDFADEFGVSHRTSDHALRALKSEGLLTSIQGKGYFVSRRA